MELLDFIFSGVSHFLSFLVIISVIVFIHEYGHFIVARWCGVKIETFSIGFGKEIFGYYDKKGTRWKFSLFPLGGYVKMFGDEGAASTPDNEKIKKLTKAEEKMAFHTQPLWEKFSIVAAGPLANFLLAIVILTAFFIIYGRSQTAPVIADIQPGSPAEEQGLKAGDRILTMDGEQIIRFEQIRGIASLKAGEPVITMLKRGEETLTLTITPRLSVSQDIFGNEVKVGVIGIASGVVEFEKMQPWQAFPAAVAETYSIAEKTLRYIGLVISGQRDSQDISGVLRIAKYSGQSVDQGITTVLMFIVVLSINLGLINLFPIPMLDGGHLLYYIVEAVRGKPLAEHVQEFGFKVGFGLLILLMLFATFNDLKYFGIF